MQNEPNFQKTKMNVTPVKINYYENKRPCKHRKNEPKTNPIKANLREYEPNTNPIYAKTNPISNFTLEVSYIKNYPFQPYKQILTNLCCLIGVAGIHN